ncbi:phosphoribosylanthranilate isomerase [Rhodoligotrophos appendicifer]|uniref:phosphoribosylanthranilate isomerase n=1 Tax=Rhodoligotrophos appendicifer TaxID=987056 RepID=UPI00117F2407|nr:phosphoribosylanthranilate isomerase [Rhodoligotrophos appendicifer]
MVVKVKICGINETAALDAALESSADLIGLVFFERSPRNVSYAMARELAERVDGRAAKVALTVDADDQTLDMIVTATNPDYLQLHGQESPDRVAQIAAHFNVPIIKAITVRDASDIANSALYGDVARLILFDARPPQDEAGALPGGNGVAFDWSLLASRGEGAPFMLSGGLTPENVAEAIRITSAPMVDVSSGVETGPGRKDPRLIRNFIEAARATG